MTTVGLIANPLAGKDVRRFVSAASLNSDRSKIEILRRCVLGAIDAGAEKVLLANDFRNLALRAVDGLNLGSKIEEMLFNPEGRRTDTTEAAKIFKKEGVKSIISLGGDGTQRDLVLGWTDAPLLPISTGTNNVFPFMVDPTVAGTAAGLLASDELILEEISKQAKVIHVELPNGIKDLALVDVVLVDDRLTGSRAVIKPDSVKQVLAAIANPASIGLASIAGRSNPVYFDDEAAVSVICDPTAKQGVFAPIMPGSVSDVGIIEVKEVELGETIELNGPGALAFDGERDFVMRENESARATVLRDGPKVINPIFAIQTAAANKVFLRKRNS
ncbi:MAG: NAD(+)/NADH kinase [Acidimicrobiales bacterium]|nr:NAD(+)/NADH kinase [Acidimicrobiales bacterium]HJO40921.1 NAD(+)/NADH kinase [Acidimicrobiales bacterium]